MDKISVAGNAGLVDHAANTDSVEEITIAPVKSLPIKRFKAQGNGLAILINALKSLGDLRGVEWEVILCWKDG